MKIAYFIIVLLFVACSSKSIEKDFTKEEIDYFTEIALGAEFGDSVPVIKKWQNDIRIKITGNPTSADLETIDATIFDLNELIDEIDILVVDKKANISIVFSPESEFSAIDSNYVPTNYGFFWALWHDDNYIIYDSSILISSENISQADRSHLIREELTQSLGLMNDSDKYEDSIFYHKWTDVNKYSQIDRTVIRLLYGKDIKPGMTKKQVLEQLNTQNL